MGKRGKKDRGRKQEKKEGENRRRESKRVKKQMEKRRKKQKYGSRKTIKEDIPKLKKQINKISVLKEMARWKSSSGR